MSGLTARTMLVEHGVWEALVWLAGQPAFSAGGPLFESTSGPSAVRLHADRDCVFAAAPVAVSELPLVQVDASDVCWLCVLEMFPGLTWSSAVALGQLRGVSVVLDEVHAGMGPGRCGEGAGRLAGFPLMVAMVDWLTVCELVEAVGGHQFADPLVPVVAAELVRLRAEAVRLRPDRGLLMGELVRFAALSTLGCDVDAFRVSAEGSDSAVPAAAVVALEEWLALLWEGRASSEAASVVLAGCVSLGEWALSPSTAREVHRFCSDMLDVFDARLAELTAMTSELAFGIGYLPLFDGVFAEELSEAVVRASVRACADGFRLGSFPRVVWEWLVRVPAPFSGAVSQVVVIPAVVDVAGWADDRWEIAARLCADQGSFDDAGAVLSTADLL